jgi:hypothetical protein
MRDTFRISLIFGPEVRKCNLFCSLHFNFDVGGLDGLHYIDKNLAVNKIAWLVEGKFSLDLDLTFLEDATGISEQKH